MADIDLLFGVAGGGDVAGESGSLIKSQLESIIKGIEPLKVKVGIDVEASKKEFASDVESLFKGASKSIKLKLDTNGIGKQLSDGAVDKSIKKAAVSFEKAESIANNYYSTLREINEANKNGLVIDIQSDGSVRALSKEFEDLAERSNRAQKEMNELKRSVYSLPDGQKAKIQEMLKVADGDYLSNMYPSATAEKQIKGVTDELKEQVYTYKEAESVVKEYSKIISDVTKNNADIEWDTTYEKYVSKSGAFAEHADSLNKIEAAYTSVVDAMDSMPMEDQIRLQKLLTKERERFNIALEASAGRDRSSFEYSDSVRAVKDYYKMLTKLEKDQEAKKHVALQDNGYWAHNEKGELEWLSKYEYISDTKDYEELASALNRTKTAFDAVVEARANLLGGQQAKLQTLMTQEAQKYNLVVEDQANKVRVAAEAKREKSESQAAIKAEAEAYKNAQKAITDFYAAQRDVAVKNADIDIGEDGKYHSLSGEFAELAERLNRTQEAFIALDSAMESLSPEHQAKITQLLTNETNELNEAIENQVRQENAAARASAESARVAAEAAQQKTIAQNKLKAEAEQYEYLERVIKDYYKAQNDLVNDKSGVKLDKDKDRYSLDGGTSSAFTERLNRTALAYKDIENAIKSLPIEQQVKLNSLIDEYAQKLREAAQAKDQQSESQAAIKAEAEAYDTAITNLKEYYKARTEALKYRDEISLNEDGTWETENRNLDAFVERLNSVTAAYNQSVDAAEKLSAKNKGLFDAARTKEVQAYNEAVQAQNRKDIDVNAAKKEADLKRYAAQVEKVNNLLLKTKKQLADWSAAKTGKSSEAYRGLEQTCNVLEEMSAELREAGTAVDGLDSKFDEVSSSAKKFASTIELAGENTKSIKSVLGNLMSTLGISFTFADAFHKAIEIGREMVQVVTEVDVAMTELKKVTEESDSAYVRFLEDAKDRAHGLGVTVTEVVNSSADFARLGYSISEATELSDAAIVYRNVGDGISDISEATNSIISTMQAFNVEATEAMTIVDYFNKTGNEFAISSGGVGDALSRSAAALAAGNNTLEESIAMIAATNTTIQNTQIVGTAMKSISMFLRASKTEAEEAGESTEGMADSVSELRKEILALTGQKVDIQIDENTFKSTYQIIKEISGVWDQLTDVTQANLLELIGGKRNANVTAALIENFDIAEDAVMKLGDSAGSALAENEKYLDSVAGKVAQLQSSLESLSTSVLSSDLVKGVVTLLDALTRLATVISDVAFDNFFTTLSTLTIGGGAFKLFKDLD